MVNNLIDQTAFYKIRKYISLVNGSNGQSHNVRQGVLMHAYVRLSHKRSGQFIKCLTLGFLQYR